MTIRHSFKSAITGLFTNKVRSMLTILGIVIGVTSIILIVSLGNGAQKLILDQIQGLGTKTIIVLPGRQPKGPSDAAQIFSDSLKPRDLEMLKQTSNAPTIARIMPLVMGGDTGFYEGEAYRLTIMGGSEEMPELFDIQTSEGDFFSEDDVKSYADVVVIGSKVKEELFGDSDAVGKHIKIKNRNLRIIGVLPEEGSSSLFNFDETAIIPYTTGQQYIFGIKYFHRLFIQATEVSQINRTVHDIQATIRDAHNITDPEKDDFHVETQADLAQRIAVITDALTAFLLAVAAISLIVGGVGIMNIMLVSVTERTREIGLRKALGATDKNILTQFLMESVVLTGLGGLVGIVLGSVFSFLISLVLQHTVASGWSYTFPYSAALLGIVVSGGIGLIFGLYPARKASKKSPIEALRYE